MPALGKKTLFFVSLFLNIVSFQLDTLRPAILQLFQAIQKICIVELAK